MPSETTPSDPIDPVLSDLLAVLARHAAEGRVPEGAMYEVTFRSGRARGWRVDPAPLAQPPN